MQNTIFIISFLLVTCFSLRSQGQNWNNSYEKAKSLAKEESKPILLVFSGSDWCAPCIKLEREIWNSKAFTEYAKSNLILLKADFPRRKKNKISPEQMEMNKELAESYNHEGLFPLVIALDNEGHILGKTGYKKVDAEDYITHLEQIIGQ